MNIPNIKLINKCRSCEGKDLKQFINFKKMPLTDDFVTQENFGQEFRADIDIFVCKQCMTVQTQHNLDTANYYDDYQYSVGASTTAFRFMELLAQGLKSQYYANSNGKKVLEIGSGDGGQLLAFKESGCQVLGFEPSSVLCKEAEAKGIRSIQGLFTADSITRLPDEFKVVDVVMLSYTFDHLPDPREFLSTAHSILNKSDGILVVEIHNFEKIIERQEYCLFEHEHSIYLTENTARHLCQLEGFEIINFDLIPEAERRANSLIFIARPVAIGVPINLIETRTSTNFQKIDFYRGISHNINQGIANIDAFVENVASQGKKIAGYGAGGRGVMTLAAMSNANKIDYLVDKKPKHPGLLAPKSGVPLVDLSHLKSNPVDKILVFSYGYMSEIQVETEPLGYQSSQFYSLLDILAGRF